MASPDETPGQQALRKARRKPPTMPPFKNVRTRWQKDRSRRRLPRYESEAHCARARRLALLGLTNAEIADHFGIPESRLMRWADRHPELEKALREGKAEADAIVAEKLYERAIGYNNHQAVKIFQGTEKSGPIVVPYVEHYPPDVNAARTWLNNRQPNLWRDRREVEHTGSLEMRLRAMTPEQRHARLLELEARAAAIVAASEPLTIEHDDNLDFENDAADEGDDDTAPKS